MRNRHPGPCYRCRETVDAGAGHFERTKDPRPGKHWRLQHAECAIFYRGQVTPWRGVPRATEKMLRDAGFIR